MDWITQAVTAVLSAGSVAAIAAAYVKVLKARSGVAREKKADETSVLMATIEELKAERDGNRKTLSDLRSEHTACLVEQESLRASNGFLRRQLREVERRVANLEAIQAGNKGS